MTARLSVSALLQRHAEWSLDQADPTTVRDLPARPARAGPRDRARTAAGPRELAERMLAALAERDGVEVERLALRLASAVLDAESYSGHAARAGGER